MMGLRVVGFVILILAVLAGVIGLLGAGAYLSYLGVVIVLDAVIWHEVLKGLIVAGLGVATIITINSVGGR